MSSNSNMHAIWIDAPRRFTINGIIEVINDMKPAGMDIEVALEQVLEAVRKERNQPGELKSWNNQQLK